MTPNREVPISSEFGEKIHLGDEPADAGKKDLAPARLLNKQSPFHLHRPPLNARAKLYDNMQVEDVAGEADFNTLTRWLMINTKDKELTVLMAQLALACKATSRACAKAGIANLFGMAGEQNSTGDDQKKLDVLSNDFFVNASSSRALRCVLVSEENEEPIIVPEEHAGRFCVAFDPLDGSSNIDCNVSTGTIFAVYERTSTGPIGEVGDILRTGNDIVAAGYCMYGAATELVMCFKQGKVERFALDPSLGEFIHTHADVQFPEGGGKKIYSCNEGNALNW